MFRAPWTSWEKQSKSGLSGMLLVYQLKQMLSAKSGFHFSCVLLFGVQTNLSISYICPGSQFTTWQLGQIPPPIWDLKRANGRSASHFISLVCDNLSVLLLTLYFSFASALCAALHNIWCMHSNRLCITVVCDTKLPINLWEWRFETGHVHVHSALQQQVWCLWLKHDLLGLS